ncbi:MAG: MGMT family protein [Firmicutes bacterium]|nr:MGMT family protein [Bacillota bacterium]
MAMKDQVYEILKTVPKGKVVTYGQIAEHLGNKNLSRVVGNILHHNPDPSQIPCHRVVNCDGKVSKSFAFGGAVAQKHLLEQEGIVFEANGKIDLEKFGINL